MTLPAEPSFSRFSGESGQRVALVVGVNGSEQADFLAPLKHAEQDTAELAQVLRRPECGFAVHMLYDQQQSLTSEQHKTCLRVILTAAGYNEHAYEHRGLTRLLLPALRGEVRDARDAAGDVVLQTLHNHMQHALPTSSLVNDITRRCVLARSAHLWDEAIQQRNREERASSSRCWGWQRPRPGRPPCST